MRQIVLSHQSKIVALVGACISAVAIYSIFYAAHWTSDRDFPDAELILTLGFILAALFGLVALAIYATIWQRRLTAAEKKKLDEESDWRDGFL